VQVDPLGFAAGDTNLYRYVTNDPENYTDPSGTWGALFVMCGDSGKTYDTTTATLKEAEKTVAATVTVSVKGALDPIRKDDSFHHNDQGKDKVYGVLDLFVWDLEPGAEYEVKVKVTAKLDPCGTPGSEVSFVLTDSKDKERASKEVKADAKEQDKTVNEIVRITITAPKKKDEKTLVARLKPRVWTKGQYSQSDFEGSLTIMSVTKKVEK
jgi:hypothetical protein